MPTNSLLKEPTRRRLRPGGAWALAGLGIAVLGGVWIRLRGAEPPEPPSPQELAWTLLATNTPQWESWPSPEDVFGSRSGPARDLQPAYAHSRPDNAASCQDNLRLVEPEAHLGPLEVAYIDKHGLQTLRGLQSWLRQYDVAFDDGSVSVKADWRILGYDDDPGHYLLRIQDKLTEGLGALHISFKPPGQPNWFWATFEQDEVPCLAQSQYVQPDNFGHPVQPGWTSVLGPADDPPSQALAKLLKAHGLSAAPWSYYRLVGVQTSYDVLLGNSEIETSLQHSSSCMACHARVRFDPATGRVTPPPVTVGDSGAPTTPPDPTWLARTRSLDFVWAFLHAH